MSSIGGPATVTSGLVLELDAGNIKSYPTTGTTWFDKSGNANNGTLINGPTFNTGSLGSIVFDGVDDYVSLGTSLNSTTTGSSFTVNMWVLSNVVIDGTTYYGLISNYSNTGGFQLFTGDGNLIYAYGSDFLAKTGTASISQLTANTWYNITFSSVKNTSGTIYINGIDRTLYSYTNTINAPNQNLKLGVRADSNAYGWNGRIALTQLYNRALSASEVQQNFNATRARFGI
jgi:hypothetical protein